MRVTPDIIRVTKPYKVTPEEVIAASKIVYSLLSQYLDLNDNQYTALVSFVLTTRKGSLSNSVLLQCLNRGEILAAADQFTKWNRKNNRYSRHLGALRGRQKKLFLRPVLAVNNEAKNGS